MKILQSMVILVLIALMAANILATIEFTNVVCTSLDKNFSDFEYCFLKSINRTYKYMSFKIKLYKIPITQIWVNYALLKKASGYKPFLYNFSIDGCKFLRSSQKILLLNFFQDLYYKYGNINHTCPYDHDIIIEKLPASHIDNMFTKVLPMPVGEYAVFITWSVHNIPRARVNVYVKLF